MGISEYATSFQCSDPALQNGCLKVLTPLPKEGYIEIYLIKISKLFISVLSHMKPGSLRC